MNNQPNFDRDKLTVAVKEIKVKKKGGKKHLKLKNIVASPTSALQHPQDGMS